MKSNMNKRTVQVLMATGLLVGVYAGTGIAQPNLVSEVSAATAVTFATTNFQTKENLNMRSGASTSFKVLVTIPKGTKVQSAVKVEDWYKVTYKGKTGYVSGTYLSKVSPAPVVTKPTAQMYETTENLNLRAGASVNQKRILTIPKGKQVTYISKSGDWYKVKYASKTGYVSAKYLKSVSVKPTPTVPGIKKGLLNRATAESHVAKTMEKYKPNEYRMITPIGKPAVFIKFNSSLTSNATLTVDVESYTDILRIQPDEHGQEAYDQSRYYMGVMDKAIDVYAETQFGIGTSASKELSWEVKSLAINGGEENMIPTVLLIDDQVIAMYYDGKTVKVR